MMIIACILLLFKNADAYGSIFSSLGSLFSPFSLWTLLGWIGSLAQLALPVLVLVFLLLHQLKNMPLSNGPRLCLGYVMLAGGAASALSALWSIISTLRVLSYMDGASIFFWLCSSLSSLALLALLILSGLAMVKPEKDLPGARNAAFYGGVVLLLVIALVQIALQNGGVFSFLSSSEIVTILFACVILCLPARFAPADKPAAEGAAESQPGKPARDLVASALRDSFLKIATVAVILGLIFGFLGSLSFSSSGGGKSRTCKSCGRSFSDSTNSSSIARTGMCSNCYGNFEWAMKATGKWN